MTEIEKNIFKYIQTTLKKQGLKLYINGIANTDTNRFILSYISENLEFYSIRIQTWESLDELLFGGNEYSKYYSIFGTNKSIFDLSNDMFSIIYNKNINLQFYPLNMCIAMCRLAEVWLDIKHIKGSSLEEIRLKMDLIGI